MIDVGIKAGRILYSLFIQDNNDRSSQAQRGPVARSPAAVSQIAGQLGDDFVWFAADAGAEVRQGGLSMCGGGASRTLRFCNSAQAARPRWVALCPTRAGRRGARSNRVDLAYAGGAGRDLRDQPGAAEPPKAGLSSRDGAVAG